MTREQRLKLIEILRLPQNDQTNEYYFQPVGSSADFYIVRSDSGDLRAGNYSRVDCRYSSLPSSYEDLLDGLLLGVAEQRLKKNEEDWRQVKEILEEARARKDNQTDERNLPHKEDKDD